MPIFFDVGANNGSTGLARAYHDKNCMVYAFEPTPEMIEKIESASKEFDNYKLIKKAVSDFNGTAIFNVAGQHDWGCSSLLTFSDKSKTDWPGRWDFVVTQQIEVEVIRLDTFIEENNITNIDYLHIDTQGSDLSVLRGLGKYINIVEAGVMEAANKDDILYVGQNTKNECIEFLKDNGFEIISIDNNDQYENEINIHFKRLITDKKTEVN